MDVKGSIEGLNEGHTGELTLWTDNPWPQFVMSRMG